MLIYSPHYTFCNGLKLRKLWKAHAASVKKEFKKFQILSSLLDSTLCQPTVATGRCWPAKNFSPRKLFNVVISWPANGKRAWRFTARIFSTFQFNVFLPASIPPSGGVKLNLLHHNRPQQLSFSTGKARSETSVFVTNVRLKFMSVTVTRENNPNHDQALIHVCESGISCRIHRY